MLCPIAEGGMASVWVARLRGKRGFEKLVAIKTILPKFASDPRFERMFLDEAGLAARIEHANVAQVLDLGEEHDVLYLTMELVDGDSLSKLLSVVEKKGQKIPTGIALRILADTCAGLHAAHEVRGRDGDLLNVVHRDVSPQNILVTMHGDAKLIDFGIAKARDRVSEDTSQGILKGKIYFMAPEQAQGRKIDRRADVFAVGAILYFLLSGKPPFAGETEIASLFLLSAGRPPLPLPASVHPAVSSVIRKALSHDADQRFATTAELEGAIEEAMAAADLITTTTNVGTFVREHMGDRAKRRKEGLDLALAAAAQREKVAQMLERASGDTPSGVSGAVALVDAGSAGVILGATEASRARIEAGTNSGSASPSVPPAGVPRRLGPVTVFVAALIAMLAIFVVVVFIVRPHNPTAMAAPPSPVPAASASAAVTVRPPSAIPSNTPRTEVPTVSAADLPSATAAVALAPRPVEEAPPTASAHATAQLARVSPRVAPAAQVAPVTPATAKPATVPAATPVSQRVNDGF